MTAPRNRSPGGRGRAWSTLAVVALGLGSSADRPAMAGGAAPPPPLFITGSAVSDTEIDLAWPPVLIAAGGVDHYVVYRDGAPVGTSTRTSYTDTGLQPSTTYQYRVSTVDGTGAEGARSTPVNVTTRSGTGGGDSTPPTAPTGLQAAAATSSQIDLQWQAATDPESGVTHYRVHRDGAFIATTSATSFSDVSVQSQTTYSYEVSAVNGDGLEGARSGAAAATTPAPPPPPPPPPPPADTTPPGVPANLEASAVTPRQVDLTWDAAADPESGVSVYRVFRNGTHVTSTAGTVLSDPGLDPETTYSYEVSAVNGEGIEGPRTAPVAAVTPAEVDTTPPAPPGRPRIVG